MKQIYKSMFMAGMLLLIFGITGCEYEGPTALYNQEHEETLSPVIQSVEPPEAIAGVNLITILGENFSVDSGRTKVYVEGLEVTVTEITTQRIVIRRPNHVGDALTIKIVNYDAMNIASYPSYKIAPVIEPYGQFLEGAQLSVVTVDKDDNVFVVQRIPKTVYKITAEGEKTILGEASKIVTDALMAPDGKLVLIANNKKIYQIDVTTGEETERLALSKKVSYADFDKNGNMYAGGKKGDLFIIKPDMSSRQLGVYARDEILAVRVYNDYVYLYVDISSTDDETPELGIWKHQILDSDGNLGDRELVLDWAATGAYAESKFYDLNFADNGMMIISTDYQNPLLTLTADGSQDVYYQNIVPAESRYFAWGTENQAYMIQGGDTWDLQRIDMGLAGAPYWGRL